MDFLFRRSKKRTQKKKIKQAPLTNLGCESEFAHLDNGLRKSGGSTSLRTLSNKHVVARNRLFEKENLRRLDICEKRRKWQWASSASIGEDWTSVRSEGSGNGLVVQVLEKDWTSVRSEGSGNGLVVQVLEKIGHL